jgi:hypothetical protein
VARVGVLDWGGPLTDLLGRVGERFTRPEPRQRLESFLLGLLGDLARKNCWTIAEHASRALRYLRQPWTPAPSRSGRSLCAVVLVQPEPDATRLARTLLRLAAEQQAAELPTTPPAPTDASSEPRAA